MKKEFTADTMLEGLLNPVFNPLLALGPLAALVLISFIVSLLITLIYKWTTDQNLMRDLKAEIKAFQKEMKELRNHPEKMMEVQKKAMETNMKYMMHSMKSTLFTFIPIILIFGWMSVHLAYLPILPGQQFTVTVNMIPDTIGTIDLVAPEGIDMISTSTQTIVNADGKSQALWTLQGKEGEYILDFIFAGKSYDKPLLITDEYSYEKPLKTFKNTPVKSIMVNHEPIKPLGSISIFSWHPGWLSVYIITSIIFSMALRKIMKIY